jgi:hypothetical protein
LLLHEETIRQLFSSLEINILDVQFTEYNISQAHQKYSGSGLIQFPLTVEGVIFVKKSLHYMGCVEFNNIHLDCVMSGSLVTLLRDHPELNAPYIPAGLL